MKGHQRLCPACAEPLLSWSIPENCWICEVCDYVEEDEDGS